jgi:hypothetical protein
MSSGNKELNISPLERAVSTDIMRGQSFSGAMLSEFLRAILNTGQGTDDLDAGGLYVPNLVQGNPLSGEILGGLLFSPAVGSVASTVTPGAVLVFDPDAAPSTDDSQYKQILDPGTSALTLTAGAGGTRIDVIECARIQPDTVLETDSRDVFNTVTGLFTAATVNKVTQAQLQYRIRTGTPGGGFPGTAQGWLPLAVASVPITATTWDTVTVWDVRPLLSDRVFQPFAVARETPLWLAQSSITAVVDGAKTLCVGNVEVTATDVALLITSGTPTYSRRRLGGRLRRGTPGADFPVTGIDGLDLSDAANQSTVTSGGTNYLYLVEPFSLPRWARYTDATTGVRQPRSPRGIPVVTNVRPLHFYGSPSSPIALPTSTGLGTTTTLKGVAILALGTVGATTQMAGAMLSGRRAAIDNAATSNLNVAVSASAINSTQIIFANLSELSNVPAFARSLNVSLIAAPTSGTGGLLSIAHVDVLDSNTGNVICSVARSVASTTNNSSGATVVVNFDIPWPAEYAGLDTSFSPIVRTIVVNYLLVGLTGPVASASLVVNSWETY